MAVRFHDDIAAVAASKLRRGDSSEGGEGIAAVLEVMSSATLVIRPSRADDGEKKGVRRGERSGTLDRSRTKRVGAMGRGHASVSGIFWAFVLCVRRLLRLFR